MSSTKVLDKKYLRRAEVLRDGGSADWKIDRGPKVPGLYVSL